MKSNHFLSLPGRQLGTLFGLIGLCLILWILSPYFLTVSNLLNIVEQSSVISIIAIGMTFVIISSGIDLSVGSILAFSGVIMASLLQMDFPIFVALSMGLVAGSFCGFLNGVLVSKGLLPPFIATLGMMSIARGAALLVTQGRPISGFSYSFRQLASGEILQIPIPVIVMLVIYISAHFLLSKTRFGRQVYAIGGSEEVSILSGVNVKKIKTLVYVLSLSLIHI